MREPIDRTSPAPARPRGGVHNFGDGRAIDPMNNSGGSLASGIGLGRQLGSAASADLSGAEPLSACSPLPAQACAVAFGVLAACSRREATSNHSRRRDRTGPAPRSGAATTSDVDVFGVIVIERVRNRPLIGLQVEGYRRGSRRVLSPRVTRARIDSGQSTNAVTPRSEVGYDAARCRRIEP